MYAPQALKLRCIDQIYDQPFARLAAIKRDVVMNRIEVGAL